MPQRAPLPVGKPILVRLDRIPAKTREKAKFQGQGVKTVVDLALVVDDKKWPGAFEEAVFWTMTDRIKSASGEYKATDSYRFIEAALAPTVEDRPAEERAQALALAMTIYDGHSLSQLAPEQAKPLLKHYVVYMKDHKVDDQGRLWQDPKEIKVVEALEWEVDARRMPADEAERQREANRQQAAANAPPLGLPVKKGEQAPPRQADKPAGALGLPKGNQPPAKAEDKPQTAPEEAQTYMLRRTFGTQADMIGELKALVKVHADFAKLKDQFLALKGAPLVGNLCEDDVKHLLVLFWLEEHRANGGVVSAKIGAECMTKHKALYQLEPAEAIFLLAASDHEATLDHNF